MAATGKAILCKSSSNTLNNVLYDLCGKVKENPDHIVVIFELTRGQPNDRDFNAATFFSTIEMAMGGSYETSKYQCLEVNTDFKHVAVMANEQPKAEWMRNGGYLSKDRWYLREIGPLSDDDRQIIQDAKTRAHQDTGKKYGPPPDLI